MTPDRTLPARRTAGPRWLIFNTVGAGGFSIHMGCLWILSGEAGVHYLAAAAIGVEAAILHNFFWHARWTWADRHAGERALLPRLARFNVLHGATAVLGLAVMAVLVEVAQLPYMAAGVMSVAACALVNFVGSDRLVFTASMAVVLLATAPEAAAGEAAGGPGTDAMAAFDRRARAAEDRLARWGSAAVATPWAGTSADDDAADLQDRLARGEVVIHTDAPGIAAGSVACGHALCHHWAASIQVQGATVADVVTLMQSYDDYARLYGPAVRQSRLVSRDGQRFAVRLQLFTRKVVSVVLNTDYDVRYVTLGADRVRVDSRTTRIAEVVDAGTPQEREKPAGTETGYLWRLNTYCLVGGQSAGVTIYCESLSLTRSIPRGLGWLVRPFVSSVPRESLAFTMNRLRARLGEGRES